ncbi:hypothetical protein ACFX2G_034954 [Malus domestica]
MQAPLVELKEKIEQFRDSVQNSLVALMNGLKQRSEETEAREVLELLLDMSLPTIVANGTYTVTTFTLMLEFNKGRLQNLYWKKDGCFKYSGNSDFVCLNNQHCAFKTSSCKSHGGCVDCSLGIQLVFFGTDKHLSVLNSWRSMSSHSCIYKWVVSKRLPKQLSL